jgi:aminoglycoside phosphotransferase (APT) family kinase protein
MSVSVDPLLAAACRTVGVDPSRATLIRAGENTLYRLPGRLVARVTRAGQVGAAAKEVRVSRWLGAVGVPVVEAVTEVAQPVEVNGRAVTFWRDLAAHRCGTTTELAELLRQLHDLPPPDFELPLLAPFVRLRERLHEAVALSTRDRRWLLDHLANLEKRYAALPPGRPWCAVHGDAWDGNVAVTEFGPVLLDLERFAYGPPEWDLASVAVDYTTFGCLPPSQWAAFCDRYGQDVTTWPGFETLRDIRELRKVTFAWQFATDRSTIAEQATYRLACIRGHHGPRPWHWTEVP